MPVSEMPLLPLPGNVARASTQALPDPLLSLLPALLVMLGPAEHTTLKRPAASLQALTVLQAPLAAATVVTEALVAWQTSSLS